MNCTQTANQHNRCRALCLQFPHCICEQHSVSSYSPGVVQDEEYLVRLIFSPTHFNEQTGQLKLFAFFDCKDKGLSVNRMQYTSVAELKQTAAFISHGIWIEQDWTENGIATELLKAGVSNEEIVLGFRHPKKRPMTEFAVA